MAMVSPLPLHPAKTSQLRILRDNVGKPTWSAPAERQRRRRFSPALRANPNPERVRGRHGTPHAGAAKRNSFVLNLTRSAELLLRAKLIFRLPFADFERSI